MRALLLGGDGFADVMEETDAPRAGGVQAHFRSHRAHQERHLHGVAQDVLREGRAEGERAHEAQHVRRDARHAGLRRCGRSGLLVGDGNLRARGRHGTLNRRGVDAPVCDQRSQRATGDLAAQGVERGEYDRVRRVVQQQRHARLRLERADVAPVAADDAPLQLRIRKLHRRGRELVQVRDGAPLDGIRDETLGNGLALLARGLLDAAGEDGGVGAELRVRAREDLAPCLLVGHLRELLQPIVGGDDVRSRLLLGGGHVGLLLLQGGHLLVQLLGATVQRVLALRKAVFDRLQLGAALLRGLVELLLRLHDGGARRDVRLLQLRLDLAFALLLAEAHLLLDRLRPPAADEPAQCVAEQQSKHQQHRDDDDRDAVRKEVPRAAPRIAGPGCEHRVTSPPSG